MWGLSRFEVEAIGLALLVAAALAWLGFHDAKVRNEATAPIIASVQAAEEAASAAATIHDVRVEAEQQGNLHEANAQNAARAADARAAAADLQRMRDDAVRTVAAAQAAASAARGAPGVDAPSGMVRAELYAWAVSARADAEFDAARLAGVVDGLRTSGGLCARDYDAEALTP